MAAQHLCEAGRAAHVVEAEDGGAALAGARDQLRRVDLLEALRQQDLPEQLRQCQGQRQGQWSGTGAGLVSVASGRWTTHTALLQLEAGEHGAMRRAAQMPAEQSRAVFRPR